ncbi:MAG: hypothetical protein P8Y95_17665, partial [Gammaproteobacteria bacterium]
MALPSAAKVLPEPTHNETENVRAEFLDAPGFLHRWREMLELDKRHLYGLADNDATDLRLDVFPGDLAGNEARQAERLQAGEVVSADEHERVISETLRVIEVSGDGSRDTPFT